MERETQTKRSPSFALEKRSYLSGNGRKLGWSGVKRGGFAVSGKWLFVGTGWLVVGVQDRGLQERVLVKRAAGKGWI